ncbi:MAG TPA: RNA polymerase sigma-54 factor [Bacteroidales bacterium]|nr:RNA polymerase sigma-54 factor [Bacteroidales bacterium]
MLKNKLQQKLLQKLSPQQIQLIKLLEVPTMQLEQRIKKEIEENPMLEEGADEQPDYEQDEDTGNDESEYENDEFRDEFSLDEYMDDDDLPAYRLNANNQSKDDKKAEVPYAEGNSFHEHLIRQLGLRTLSKTDYQIAEYLIGNIDEDGYLRRDLEDITDDLAFSLNISTTEEKLHKLLKIIQDFEPAGIGARDLQESLFLQVERKYQLNKKSRSLELLRTILLHYFDEFTKKHFDKIIDKLNITEEELKDAINEVLRLNPKPGTSFNEEQTKSFQQITPDFILDVVNSEIQLWLNSKNAPELRINRHYAEMLESYSANRKKQTREQKDTITFVKQKLDSAKWFIDAIKQRQNTLQHTMEAIVGYQQGYFLEGDETKLRPMILKDIAEKTGLDISTISRVANSKYIQTHFGIFPLKFFFSEGMATDTGEEVSTREIKKILQDCVDGESKRRPLTDEKLAKILQEKGYLIARRTVAKYREQLGIPVARLRKEL